MAMRGEFLFTGYMVGRGRVRVFHDLDSTTHVFAMKDSGDTIYTTRDRIQARKTYSKDLFERGRTHAPKPTAQPTLF